jgi:hypothetical protein
MRVWALLLDSSSASPTTLLLRQPDMAYRIPVDAELNRQNSKIQNTKGPYVDSAQINRKLGFDVSFEREKVDYRATCGYNKSWRILG